MAHAFVYLCIDFCRILILDQVQMHTIFHDPKICKALLVEKYHIKMVDETGIPLYPTNYNMPLSINHPRPMALQCELDIFYDTLEVCDCSKCKRLKANHVHVTLSHYINDQLPKIDGLLPPIVFN